jgi:cache domain-containing protein
MHIKVQFMLNIKIHREKDSLILLALVCSVASVASVVFLTIASPNHINAVTNNTSNSKNNSTITNATTASNNLITNILARNLENHLLKAGAILNVTSKLPQVRNVSSSHLLNQTLKTLHGIPKDADIQKRQVAQNILSNYKDFQVIFFIMPNGDIYFNEPYSRQQMLTTTNFAFRDYFQGVLKTHDIYLGNPYISASSGQLQSAIAVPIYSLKDNSTLAGIWSGGIDFGVLSKELQSVNLTANGKRVVYVGHNGQKLADSDVVKSKIPESLANLNSFKSAINGQSGSVIDTVKNTKMLVTYQPVKAFHNTWVVLLMQSLPQK